MALKPLNRIQPNCFDISDKYNKITIEDDTLEQSFLEDQSTEDIYLNFDFSTKYKAMISEGKTKDLEFESYKVFYSYPYKEIKFKIGDYISFVDDTGNMRHWLIESLDTQRYDQVIGRIYKCDNVVRFITKDYFKLIEYPCVFCKNATRDTPYYTNVANILSGIDYVKVQYNKYTKQITEDDRLLFNGKAYKVSNVGNHGMNVIEDSESVGIIRLTIDRDLTQSEDDDIQKNITNKNKLYTFSLNVNQEIVNGNVNDLGKIIAEVYKNGVITNEEILYEIIESNPIKSEINCTCAEGVCSTYGYVKCECEEPIKEDVIKINNDGSYELLSIGNAKVKVSMKNNTDIFKVVAFNISEKPKEDIIKIIISPKLTEIKQGMSQEYKYYKTINGKKTKDKLTICDNSTIKNGYYNILINEDNNTFTIENIKKHSSKKVEISVSDNVHSTNISIKLGDVW